MLPGHARAKLGIVETSLSRLSVGGAHACYRASSGTVSCWGTNADGELGDGTTTGSAVPIAVTGITNAVAVSAGSRHSCALLSDGTVSCWGANNAGQLGNGTETSSSTPVTVTGITGATQVNAGGAAFTSHTCALLKNRTVSCWGGNHDGELGNGLRPDSSVPVQVTGLSNAVQISAGLRHSCALLATGAVECWGWGSGGQLGNGKKHSSSVPVRVKRISTAIQIAAGGGQSCALLSSGAVKCWGSNGSGELGIGKREPSGSTTPVPAKIPGRAVRIGAGFWNTCALLTTGATYCWGSNDGAELGVGKTFWHLTQSYRPLRVKGLSKASSLSVGDEDACVVLATGGIKCWGDDGSGQLGNGMTGLSSTPVVVKGVSNATAIDADGSSTCALLKGGTVSCWGRNWGGKLGISAKVEIRPVPALVKGVTDAVAVTGGADHACVIISGGTVSCWGADKSGQLGNGEKTSSITPVKVSGISNAVQIGAGDDFTCALLASRSIKCWGINDSSQLGNGTTISHTRPVRVSGITDAVALDVSGDTGCVVLSAGALECWGGYNPTDPMANTGTALPTKVQGLAKAVEASAVSQCALISGGTVSCWGKDPLNSDNDYGSIHAITGLANGVQLGAACALLAGGGVDCWGSSEFGQLGNGTVSFSGSYDTAVAVNGITDATAISSSGADACAVLSAGTVECWGDNYWGQLGDGEQGFRSLPVSVVGLP
jgi:alpha-tubulin suppressor-like RCC1 family protein